MREGLNERLKAVLENRGGNYLLPFFWLHGAEEGVLRETMARISDAGAGAVCVESRPHPDFAGPKWFRDMDVILEEAGRLGMRVWLLDDKAFPTGSAAGLIKSKYPQHSRLFAYHHAVDALGPMKGASFLIGPLLRDPAERVVSVTASRRTGIGLGLSGDMLDLTGRLENGRLHWDVPEGLWTVVFVYASRRIGPAGGENYLNPISPQAVDVLIEGVYEPHYERYKALFGNVFAGFFSDEPQFYNFPTLSKAMVGRLDMPLPWSGELGEQLKLALGEDSLRLLPCLWFDGGERAPEVRYAYMDALTGLSRDHFCNRLAGWCHARGVEYIGHVLEDNNSHSRLGQGNGHYFRSLWGQDMAGVDIVLNEIRPGFDKGLYRWEPYGVEPLDGEFFHYALAKLGSSLAHIDPKKRGRALCENFGAYGWAEGLRLMKWLADHAIVRGINYMTPHAFNDHEFPDGDSPPHFYARGHNPQYRFTKILFRYINRLCHLFSGGTHVAPAAVLYNAEAEWWGGSMLIQKPMKALMRRQIDCDVLPCDLFRGGMDVVAGADGDAGSGGNGDGNGDAGSGGNGDAGARADESAGGGGRACGRARLAVNGETYKCLVIPYAEALPRYFVEALEAARGRGLPVFFVDGYPAFAADGGRIERPERLGETVELARLADRLALDGHVNVLATPSPEYLRVYHYRHGAAELFMFFNESPDSVAEAVVELPTAGPLRAYDAMGNVLRDAPHEKDAGKCKIRLRLSPDQSVVFAAGDGALPAEAETARMGADAGACPAPLPYPLPEGYSAQKLDVEWEVSVASCEAYPNFTRYKTMRELANINGPDELPEFSGTVRYEAEFCCEGVAGAGARARENVLAVAGAVMIDLGRVFETAELWINGEYMGARICRPYLYDVAGAVRPGRNRIAVEVTNTLAKQVSDYFSAFAMQDPGGLLGDVTLLRAC
jgi:hypothetical protein